MPDPLTLPYGAAAADLTEALRAAELFSDLVPDDLERVAAAMRRVSLGADEMLWRKGDPVDGLSVVESGEVVITARLPGDRVIELARLGRGEAMGEVPLIDGGARVADARTTRSTTLLFLDRSDFLALMSGLHPSALALRRAVIRTVAARLRRTYEELAASIGAAGARGAGSEALGEPVEPPPVTYLARLPFFAGFRTADLAELVRRGRVTGVPSHAVLVAEGGTPAHLWVVLNGAVQSVMARGEHTIRVGLAGPGRAVGYPGACDGAASPVTIQARERAVLLALPAGELGTLLVGNGPLSRQLLAALQRDMVRSLREADRPQARLAAQRAPVEPVIRSKGAGRRPRSPDAV